jgi:hypothetical protein
MGCLASHAGWNHPATEHLSLDAGINWLHRVAHLNPATSVVIREWDSRAQRNFEFRADLLEVFLEEERRRQGSNESDSFGHEHTPHAESSPFTVADASK